MRKMFRLFGTTMVVAIATVGTQASRDRPVASIVSYSATAAQSSRCKDVSLEVTIVPIEGSALSGDSKGSVYADGVDGVYNAVIHVCGSNPSYDATLGMVTSKRSMGVTFPPAIDGSTIFGSSPVWANGVQFMAKPFLNVRNILWGRKNLHDPHELWLHQRAGRRSRVFSALHADGDRCPRGSACASGREPAV